ncbi:MAG TPA: MarR family transcriptional regulator [Candidatus Limnocylindrales bacterium]|nr:MarR family transcriptional regulator [Candidatus Limnocylindrales bacterium]
MTDDKRHVHASEVAATVAAFARLMDLMAAAHQPPMDVNVSMAQLRCLHLIAATGETRMSRLVSLLGVSISTVSGLVDRLVDRGFVTRHDDPADRRQVVIAATPAGTAFLDQMRDLGNAQFRELIARLRPDELRTVRRSIEILSRVADEATAVSAPDPRKERP